MAYEFLFNKVCVEKCPETSFSAYAVAKTGQNAEALRRMRPFCDPYVSGASDWNRKDAIKLIKEGVCPAWVLASTPVLGRCIPASNQLKDNIQRSSPRILTSQNIRTQNRQQTGNRK